MGFRRYAICTCVRLEHHTTKGLSTEPLHRWQHPASVFKLGFSRRERSIRAVPEILRARLEAFLGIVRRLSDLIDLLASGIALATQ